MYVKIFEFFFFFALHIFSCNNFVKFWYEKKMFYFIKQNLVTIFRILKSNLETKKLNNWIDFFVLLKKKKN